MVTSGYYGLPAGEACVCVCCGEGTELSSIWSWRPSTAVPPFVFVADSAGQRRVTLTNGQSSTDSNYYYASTHHSDSGGSGPLAVGHGRGGLREDERLELGRWHNGRNEQRGQAQLFDLAGTWQAQVGSRQAQVLASPRKSAAALQSRARCWPLIYLCL